MLQMRLFSGRCYHAFLLLAFLGLSSTMLHKAAAQTQPPEKSLWTMAHEKADHHRFSTLFTAQDVQRSLSNSESLQQAIDWCKETGITKVYIETFRNGYQAEKAVLENATRAFRKAGLIVSGCITPTKVGKPSTGWKELISCYTDQPTQEKVEDIFRFAAGLFDEIMIDDFWFTDCACAECETARKDRQVRIGDKSFPVNGDDWDDYRCELMVQLSREKVLKPARSANPRTSLIIKYPQWYDNFHMRGYEVVRETADFDQIWVGTETRDYDDARWGGTPQYEAYFIMRWLGGLDGPKCGGGWYDPFGTTEATYLEQARQTVLAGARESMLFAYGPLQNGTGPANIKALRLEIAELLQVSEAVRERDPIGIAAYKPPGSHPGKEGRVFDFVGMMGLPLLPCHEFPTNASAAFFSVHALKDAQFLPKLQAFIESGKPVLITDGLAGQLEGKIDAAKFQILPVRNNPKGLLELGATELDTFRKPLLASLKHTFTAPNRVGLYLFSDNSWVVENFNDTAVNVTLNGAKQEIPSRDWVYKWK